MSQIIFPNERDLGAMLSIQGPKSSAWNWIKLDLGLFNGTGAPGAGSNTSDFDKFKDFIGHLGMSKSTKSENIKWGIGVSYYDGGFRQDVSDRYKFGTDSAGVKGFTIDQLKSKVSSFANNRGRATRTYIGADAQISIDWKLGLTTFRAEYIQGDQPGFSGSSTSPSSLPVTSTTSYVTTIDTTTFIATTKATTTTTASDIYLRKFNGAYLYLVQNIGQSPLQAIVKYDWYDPNTDVKGDEIGTKAFGNSGTDVKNTTNSTDLKYSTLGMGLAYRWDTNIKITGYYDIVKNETSKNLNGYADDLADNVFTLRVQVKF
jgi:hypothetical protein